MIKQFKKIPFPVKLTSIGLVPLLLLIALAIQIAQEKNETIRVIGALQEEVNTSIIASELNSQIHLERRAVFSFLIGKESREQLAVQQARTDAARQVLKQRMGSGFDQYQAYTLLSQLDSIRNITGKRAFEPAQAILYYSAVLTRMNTITAAAAEGSPKLQAIRPDIAGQRLVAQITNNLGQLRTVIYSALVRQELTADELFSVEHLHQLLQSQYSELQAVATPQVRKELERIARAAPANYTSRGITKILQNKKTDPSLQADQWWAMSAVPIDNLKEVQLRMLERIQVQIKAIYQTELQDRTLALTLTSVAILVVVLLIILSIRSITQALADIRYAAERIALGETGTRATVETRDAIGSLALSINQIESTNRQLSKAAEKIGQGDFDVHVEPRGESDTLGNAIILMKTNLQAYNKENQEKAWIQSGVRKVNESLLGDKTVAAISQEALNTLAGYLRLELGLCYISGEPGELHFACGYAIQNTETIARQLRFGETMVGQAALDREPIHLENVPNDFLKVTSAAGAATPQNLLIVPLVYNNSVEGVLELASLKPISKASMALVEQVAPNLAIAIQTAKSKARLQELLEETQTQAEELQAQHSELECLNSELEAQAQELQASEEELKAQQQELVQANQELEERSNMLEDKNRLIVDRNLEIQQKAEELALSTKYKSEFLANMSHELRTPLNSILLLSRLMAENEDHQLNAEQVEYAEVIQSSGKALLSLIDEILDLSKIEAGKMDLEYQPTAFDDIIREVRALFKPMAAEKNLELELIKAANLPERFVTDQMRLGQILKNLLSNALKFTPTGKVSLTVKPSADHGYIDFAVADTGIGIPKDKQNQIFEAFQQADGSTKRKFGGTGLGLSISRELARLLGGYLTLESEPGKGSIFTLTLPEDKVTAPAAEQAKKPAAADPVVVTGTAVQTKPNFRVQHIPGEVEDDREKINPGDPVILIIEDDTIFATALLKFTNQKGYKGIISVRGDEGIRMARQFMPKAILLDVMLPVKDGWEVMQELKADPVTRPIPVHIMSSEEFKKESLQLGAVDFVSKPFAMEQMQHIFYKVDDVLNRHPKKVLIVEENPKHAQALHHYLSNCNVATEVRGSIQDGVETLSNRDVDCVILDMGIPDQHAYQTLETVKQTAGLESLPIIVFTGKSLSRTEETRIRQYADSIVLKTAQSYQRILDEVALFLHLVEEEKPNKRRSQSLGALNDVLQDKKVLIADDDVRNIFSLTKALEAHKMTVLSATDGAEALKLLEANPDVDVVLMDMMMPEMDGYETIQRIRQDSRNKDLPILAVTAKAMMGDRQKCINAGASDYISKPVDIDQLISLLRVWVYDKGISL